MKDCSSGSLWLREYCQNVHILLSGNICFETGQVNFRIMFDGIVFLSGG